MIHGANKGHEYVFHELFLLFKTAKTLFFRLFYPLIPIYLVPFSAFNNYFITPEIQVFPVFFFYSKIKMGQICGNTFFLLNIEGICYLDIRGTLNRTRMI